jgi:hypothetical protein
MSFRQILAVRRWSSQLLPVTFVCFLLGWFSPHELQAQRILIQTGGGQKEKLELYNQLNNFLEGRRTEAKNRIRAHLLEIDRVCELTPKQRTHLEIAGKGAVISYADKTGENLESMVKGIGFEFKRGNPPEEDPDDEQDEGNNNRRIARVIDFSRGLNGDTEENVDSEQIWVDSVKKTLTEAQLENLESSKIAKEKIIRQAAVDYLIARADLKLFLSLEQRQKLESYVDREYGPQLVLQMKVPPKQNRNFIVPGRLQPNRGIEVDDSLKAFLSKPQLEIWRTDFQNDLDSLED